MPPDGDHGGAFSASSAAKILRLSYAQ